MMDLGSVENQDSDWNVREHLRHRAPDQGFEFGGLIADKAFDSNWIVEDLNERRAKIVISQHQRRTKPLDIGKDIYKWRHHIENFSAS
jgi:hypothetical protein